MTDEPVGVSIEAAAVTDRGLSEKRPENEDSMLSDPALGVFAVADGVGGAQAGEVASQTAIEVLQEAFANQRSGEDVEDLMEIAIQRANDSIYRMSREQPRFAMMATTIVALHLEGLRATVGHVGDSRLYRFAPDGRLSRETDDHSLVEEEMRAGRLTPEQAATHPNRNVISRALGAEASVEVDMRTFDVESGTVFLLCSDGITRHIPDDELSAILRDAASLEAACEEMKRRCYERGAEDNLTAVLVRVGGSNGGREAGDADDDAPTLIRERADVRSAQTLPEASPSLLRRPFDTAGCGDRRTRRRHWDAHARGRKRRGITGQQRLIKCPRARAWFGARGADVRPAPAHARRRGARLLRGDGLRAQRLVQTGQPRQRDGDADAGRANRVDARGEPGRQVRSSAPRG